MAHLVEGQLKDIGDFAVRRVLPTAKQRHVGPFVFLDHFGPVQLPKGQGLDVRPHPHIGLATVTYLFEGEIVHRDSLGYEQTIVPGEVNWMVAGKGIVHSERTPDALRQAGARKHGIQMWVALPTYLEDCEPSFAHYDQSQLGHVVTEAYEVNVLAGSWLGATSEVDAPGVIYHVVRASSEVTLPLPDAEERGVYVVLGQVTVGGQMFDPGQLAVCSEADAEVSLLAGAVALIIGGTPVGERHMFWNFVSSDRDKIEVAKHLWQQDGFAKVPGESERIPLPPG